jgi:hypothetical protein
MSDATPTRRIRERLGGHMRTNVIAYLALFVALGGTGAWAADKITSNDIARNAIRAKHIRKNAVRTPKIKNGAVTRAKLAAPTLFAFIRDFGGANTANIEYGKGVTAVTDDSGNNGHYTVTFNRSLANCVVEAQQGIGNPAGSSGAATIGPAHPDVSVGFLDDGKADVTFYNGSNVTADTAFMITAFC